MNEFEDQISFIPSNISWNDLLEIENAERLARDLVDLGKDLIRACQSGDAAQTDLSVEVKVILTLMAKFQSSLNIVYEGFKLLLNFVLVNVERNCLLILINGGVLIVTRSMGAHEGDSGVQTLGCSVLHSLSTSAAHKELVVRNPNVVMFEGVRAILAALTYHTADARIAGLALSSLQNMSFNERSSEFVASLGGADCIVAAMRAHGAIADVQAPACWSLLNMSANGPALKRVIVASGGVAALLATLVAHPSDRDVLVPCCGALHSLATRSPAHKTLTGDAGAVPLLVAVLNAHWTDPAVVRPAVWALQTLSADHPPNAARLAAAAAAPVLLRLVAAHAAAGIAGGDVVRPACWALESLLAADPAGARAAREDPACRPAVEALRELHRAAPEDGVTAGLLLRLDTQFGYGPEGAAAVGPVASESAGAQQTPRSVFL